jgi:hypothetical protein
MFNDNVRLLEHNTEEFFEAPMPTALSATGIDRLWRMFLVNDLYLFRYRRRERGLSLGFVSGKRVLDKFGYHRVDGVFDEAQRERLRSPSHGYRKLWLDYVFGGPSVKSFEAILADAGSRGIRCVVVNMPFRPELLELPGDGRQAYAVYVENMLRLRDQYGFAWLDYEESLVLDDADFRDVDHLNGAGAGKLSARLGRDISTMFEEGAFGGP